MALQYSYNVRPSGLQLVDGVDLASIQTAINLSPIQNTQTVTASGALSVASSQIFITATSAAALTLVAPTQAQNGTRLSIFSTTNFAHSVTSTGNLQTGTAAVNTATFSAFAGASLELIAYNGKWLAYNFNACTFS